MERSSSRGTKASHRQQQDAQQRERKQANLEMLEWGAAVGEIDLYYLDEAEFSLWSESGYSYFFVGQQKRIEQTKRRGRRVSILGIWQPLDVFHYRSCVGGFDSASYIKMMDAQAEAAAQLFAETGRIRDCSRQWTDSYQRRGQGKAGRMGIQRLVFALFCQVLL